MAKVFINESTLVDISDAIRAKTGKTDLIKPGDWATELDNVEGAGKYLWSKKGMADTYTTTSGSATKTLVTVNSSIAEAELEWNSDIPVYDSETGLWEFNESTGYYGKGTIKNTDEGFPDGVTTLFNRGGGMVAFYVRLTSEPNIWYKINADDGGALNVGAVSTLGTRNMSITYHEKYEVAAGDVLGYAVSDDSAKYTSGAWGKDGYYYESVE